MKPGRIVGRYALYDKLAAGGMATIHVACTLGAVGFARVVVVKRLHTKLAAERGFVAMFVDEARIASRIRHPNVIPMLDVVAEDGELFLVMEYAHGESLARLVAKAAKLGIEIPPSIVSAVGIAMLEGLHAAHEATSERGEPLALVHRDVSPQNVIVGADGIPRVFDFGVAKAAVRIYETDDGTVRGKCAYMSPEQITNAPIDRRTDIWAAGVVLWEMATRRRLFVCAQPADYIDAILKAPIPPPSQYAPTSEAFDRLIAKALERDPDRRFRTARELATALEDAIAPANGRTVGDWVQSLAADAIAERAALVKQIEESTNDPEATRRELAELELHGRATDEEEEPPESSDMPTTTAPHTKPLVEATQPMPRVSAATMPPPAPVTGATNATNATNATRFVRVAGVLAVAATAIVAVGFGLSQRKRPPSHIPEEPTPAIAVSQVPSAPVSLSVVANSADLPQEAKPQASSSASPARRPAGTIARPRAPEPTTRGIDWNSRK